MNYEPTFIIIILSALLGFITLAMGYIALKIFVDLFMDWRKHRLSERLVNYRRLGCAHLLRIGKTFSVLIALSFLAFTGCKNISPATQKAILTQGVATGVEVGLLKSPTARPYLVAVTPIVCAEANGTNPSPAQIVAAIQAANLDQTKTPEALLIVNGVLGIYSAFSDQIGTNSAQVQLYADALCDGLQQGLAFSPDTTTSTAGSKRGLWSFKRQRIVHSGYPPHLE